MKAKFKAFTFVELIVVLTIIAILATIWFTVYESYLWVGRDTNRIVQLKDIHSGLTIHSTTNRLPLPDKYTKVKSWTNTLFYQWNISDAIIKTIKYNGWWRDVDLDIYPTYALSKNKKDFQLLWFLEDAESIVYNNIFSKSQAASANYATLFPKTIGAPIGIMLDSSNQTPLQETDIPIVNEYDILTGTGELRIYYTDKDFFDTSWGNIFDIIPNRSCKRINDMWKSKWNDFYIILPDGINAKKVYCDMDLDGWWWTLVARSVQWATWWSFGWIYSLWDVTDDTQPFSYWSGARLLDFSEIALAGYSNGKNIEFASKHTAGSKFLKDTYDTVPQSSDINNSGDRYILSDCEYLIPHPTKSSQAHCIWWDRIDNWWRFWLNTKYFLSRWSTHNYGLNINGMSFVWGDEYTGEQWMLFVR